MADIKYNRISHKTQSLIRQEVGNENYDKVFTDIASGKDTNRPQLQAMLEYVREGDTLTVESYSRLARNTADLLAIVERLNEKGVILISKKEGLNTSTPTGKLILTMFGALATFERECMLERQQEGYKARIEAGLPVGRPAIEIDKKFRAVVKRWRDGEITAVEAYTELKVSKAFFYKAVKKHNL